MTSFRDEREVPSGTLHLAEILERSAAGRELPLKFTAYDGSSAGPDDAELGLDLRTPRGTTYLATAPGDLGLARAYVCGDIEAQGVHSSRSHRRRRRPCRGGGASPRVCGTARSVTPTRFTTTTTCPTRSTSGCSARR